MNSQQIIGERVKFYRMSRGLTQKELEEALGLSDRYISSVEQGRRTPSTDLQMKICQFFGINMADLVPLDKPAELTPKDIMIGEIVHSCRALEVSQIGMVKTMVCSLSG